MANPCAPTKPEPLWRRVLRALSQAFDPAREGRFEDTVFQPGAARARPLKKDANR